MQKFIYKNFLYWKLLKMQNKHRLANQEERSRYGSAICYQSSQHFFIDSMLTSNTIRCAFAIEFRLKKFLLHEHRFQIDQQRWRLCKVFFQLHLSTKYAITILKFALKFHVLTFRNFEISEIPAAINQSVIDRYHDLLSTVRFLFSNALHYF